MAIKYSIQEILNLADLAQIFKDLVDILKDPKKINAFLDQIENIEEIKSLKEETVKTRDESLALKAENEKKLKDLENREFALLEKLENFENERTSFKASKLELQTSQKQFIDTSTKLENDKKTFEAQKQRFAEDTAKLSKTLENAVKKEAELTTKIQEVNVKLSKLKEI